MAHRPGTPSLLRELNDRAALELLLSTGPLTRTQLGEATGLSKVTASQLLGRLAERGLVQVVGELAGGRGPNAALYAVVPSCAYVAGLDVVLGRISAAVADITGAVVGEARVDLNGVDDPVALVHGAVVKAVRAAGVALPRLRAFVIGTPGVVDPYTGDVRFAFDLPEWHDGVLAALRRDLRARSVCIENDVNLAAVAEQAVGAGREADDFALMWVGQGLGLAVVLGGRLYRGFAGGAGEIGWLPVPGVPLPPAVGHPEKGGPKSLQGGFQSLVGPDAVHALAQEHGFARKTAPESSAGPSGSVPGVVAASVAEAVAAGPAGAAFLDALAERLAVGVASVCVILDPGLVVLSGEVGRAGGTVLAERVQRAVARICPNPSRVTVSSVEGSPVLRGALLVAVEAAREEVFSAPD